jgi:hypothetical protein
MYEELFTCDCYVREHEVVNLFVFGHLVPMFMKHDLDLRQIGIEYPVLKVKEGVKSKRGARKDLVIWPRSAATLWNGYRPLAVIEWKHISRITSRPPEVRAAHLKDINWLTVNKDMMRVGYAVLVERTASDLLLTCTRVQGESNTSFLRLPAAEKAVSA